MGAASRCLPSAGAQYGTGGSPDEKDGKSGGRIEARKAEKGRNTMAREYICLYHSYLDAIEALDDAERGRLLTAMLEYT